MPRRKLRGVLLGEGSSCVAREHERRAGTSEAKGGSARDEGYTQIDGRRAHKITFVHDRAIAFTRYFDVLTGKLLLTEAEGGGTIREEGEIIVNGVTFPRRVITTNRLPDGSERSVIVTFDKVEVNLTFPASTFAMPALGSGT